MGGVAAAAIANSSSALAIPILFSIRNSDYELVSPPSESGQPTLMDFRDARQGTDILAVLFELLAVLPALLQQQLDRFHYSLQALVDGWPVNIRSAP